MSSEETKKFQIWSYWMELVTGKFQRISRQFPVHIAQTEKQPDIVAWSDSKKSVLLIELTVPWEENREEAHEQKKNRYETLRADCVEKGWICHVIPVEVGCRGFPGHSVISFFFKNRHQCPQFESCLKSSSDDGAICIKLDLVEGVYIYIYIYIIPLNTLSGDKSCLVAPGVAVQPWATETVLSPLVGGWWGQGIAHAFTRCMTFV